MRITFACPSCAKEFNVPEEMAGCASRCTQCNAALVVPGRSTAIVAKQPLPQPTEPAVPMAQEVTEPLDDWKPVGFQPEAVPACQPVYATEADANRFKRTANGAVGAGIAMMFLGSTIRSISMPGGWAIQLVGWGLVIWGCANYMRWKGYSGWFGLFGYLLLPGLLILVCFPNRRKRLVAEGQFAEMDALSARDGESGFRYLLAVAPLPVLFFCISIPWLLLGSHVGPASSAKEFISREGKFSVRFPRTPVKQERVEQAPAGKLVFHLFLVDGGGRGYLVGYCDLPAKVIKDQGAKSILDRLAKGNIVGRSKGKVANVMPIVLSDRNLPGRELQVEFPDNKLHGCARVFLSGNRLYQVLATGPENFVTGKEATAFLDSFKVLND